MSMQIAFITVDRKPATIFNTLESFAASSSSLRCDLFVGSLERAYLEPIGDIATIVPMPPEIWEKIAPMRTWQRACANFLRALEHQNGDVLLCEDDIAFKPGWTEALQRARQEEPEAIVTLYSTVKFRSTDPPLVKLLHFYGTCGIFVPAKHRKPLASFVTERLGFVKRDAFDELVAEYARDCLFATNPSWIDHVGAVSAISENQGHGRRSAPSF
jgi:hypothetical protein